MTTIAKHILTKYIGLTEKLGNKNSPTVLSWIKKFFPSVENTAVIAWCSIGMIKVCQELKIDCLNQTPAAISWNKWGVKIGLNDIDIEKNQIVIFKRKGGHHVSCPVRYSYTKQLIYCIGFNQSDACTVQGYPVSDLTEVRQL